MGETGMKSHSTLMTEGSVWKHIIRFAIPLFWGNLFQQMYNLADSLIVGNFLGSDALAAVASSGHIVFLLVGLFNGIFTGAGVVISRHFGARDEKSMSRAIHTAVAFGLAAGAAVTVIGSLLVPQLLEWMGTPESVLPNSIRYFRTYFYGVIFIVLYNTANGIFQAVGDSRHPLYYLIISSVTNVVLDLLFVGPLHMGVEGAALATVISQAVSVILGFWKLTHVAAPHRVYLRKIRFHLPTLKDLLAMGLPAGLQNSIISIANVVVQSSINLFGAMAMAGCGAYSRIEGFAFLPVNCFGLAMATFVGQNLGAKEYARARRGARFGVLSCMLMSELIGVCIYTFSPFLIALFNADPQVVQYGVLQARTGSLFFFLMACTHGISAVLRGAGRSIVPMTVMLVCWCLIRVSYILFIARSSGNIQMVFWAYPLTWSLSTICLLIYYFRADWPHYLEKRSAAA